MSNRMRRVHRKKLLSASVLVFLIAVLWMLFLLEMRLLRRSQPANSMERRRGPLDCAAVSSGLFTPVGVPRVCRIEKPGVMVDLTVPREYNRSQCPVEPAEPEDPRMLEFLDFFTKIFREKFNNLPWWMDEGSLLGVARAGSIKGTDDDFDFLVLLPNSASPCRSNSLECTPEEFSLMIHRFLIPFWEAGACIRWYNPDATKYDAGLRLMYTLQLHRRDDLSDPLNCFDRSAPVAHMHLGMLNADGELETNKWVAPGTHPKDKIPLSMLLPVRRCRMGNKDAPCPNDIVGFLTMRNQGKYVNPSREGRCLLIKKGWSLGRRVHQVQKVKLLHDCGYASMINLTEPLIDSGYGSC